MKPKRKRQKYQLEEFKLIGFSMENKPEGEGTVQVLIARVRRSKRG